MIFIFAILCNTYHNYLVIYGFGSNKSFENKLFCKYKKKKDKIYTDAGRTYMAFFCVLVIFQC